MENEKERLPKSSRKDGIRVCSSLKKLEMAIFIFPIPSYCFFLKNWISELKFESLKTEMQIRF